MCVARKLLLFRICAQLYLNKALIVIHTITLYNLRYFYEKKHYPYPDVNGIDHGMQ